MKSFAPKPWVVPQPVLIIGTYDKNGKPNAMNAACHGTAAATDSRLCHDLRTDA